MFICATCLQSRRPPSAGRPSYVPSSRRAREHFYFRCHCRVEHHRGHRRPFSFWQPGFSGFKSWVPASKGLRGQALNVQLQRLLTLWPIHAMPFATPKCLAPLPRCSSMPIICRAKPSTSFLTRSLQVCFVLLHIVSKG